jgi:phytoene synthase
VLHQRIALTPLRKLWIAWRTWVFGPPARLQRA